jgi:uncharacterized protein
MKTSNLLIFLFVALSVYSSVNFYILFRGYKALHGIGIFRIVIFSIFLITAISYPAGRIIEKFNICPFSDICIHIGSIWLAYMLYLFLAVLSVDVIIILNRFIPLIPEFLIRPDLKTRIILVSLIFSAATVTVIAGYLNARNPVYREVTLPVTKNGFGHNHLRILMISDVHLGTIISNSHVDHLVEMINAKNPDVVLFAGDLIDEDLKPVIQNNLGEALRGIKATYGIYAVNGNHEFIGGADEADHYIEQHGIRVLRDEAVTVADALVIVGREDLASFRFAGKKRLALSDIMKDVPLDKTIVLMDHQPFNLEEGRSAGVDLQLSGHTHRGQLWPMNYLTKKIYEIDFGTLKKDGSTVIVSTGFGTWGPPVRTGNTPEIVVIDINFNQSGKFVN